MCMSLSVYVCVYLHVCVFACVCVCMWSTCMCACVCVHVWTYTLACFTAGLSFHRLIYWIPSMTTSNSEYSLFNFVADTMIALSRWIDYIYLSTTKTKKWTFECKDWTVALITLAYLVWSSFLLANGNLESVLFFACVNILWRRLRICLISTVHIALLKGSRLDQVRVVRVLVYWALSTEFWVLGLLYTQFRWLFVYFVFNSLLCISLFTLYFIRFFSLYFIRLLLALLPFLEVSLWWTGR